MELVVAQAAVLVEVKGGAMLAVATLVASTKVERRHTILGNFEPEDFY
jgi:hypothetical protein